MRADDEKPLMRHHANEPRGRYMTVFDPSEIGHSPVNSMVSLLALVMLLCIIVVLFMIAFVLCLGPRDQGQDD